MKIKVEWRGISSALNISLTELTIRGELRLSFKLPDLKNLLKLLSFASFQEISGMSEECLFSWNTQFSQKDTDETQLK